MKTSKLLKFLPLLLLVGIVSVAYALSTFTIHSNVTSPVGYVTVYTSNGTADIMVTGYGDFQGSIPEGNIIGIGICGQGLQVGTSARITLPDGSRAKVTWSGPNIIFIDTDDVN